MNDAERAERTAKLKADRVARGLPPLIHNESVYRLLSAVIDSNDRKNATVNK
jgi:hypothetical protein